MSVGLLAIAFAWRVLLRDETVAPRRLEVMGFAMVSPGLALLLFGLVGAATLDWRFSPQHALANTAIPAIAYTGTFWLLAGLATAGSLAAWQLPGVRSRA